MFVRQPIIVAVIWLYSFLFLGVIVTAASGKMDEDDTEDDKTAIPASAPFVAERNSSPAPVLTQAPVPEDKPNDIDKTEDQEEGSTEDQEEGSTENSTDEIVQMCRSISRGIAVTTNTSIEIIYNFEILSTTATPSYTGIAVNNAVTNHLIDLYIKPYCNKNRHTRQLQWHRSMQTVFASGDVRGIERGTTTVQEESCAVPSEDIGSVACHRLQSANTIHFRNDYVTNKDDLSILENAEDIILMDISSAFVTGTITDEVVKGGEALVNATYLSGTSAEVWVQGEARSIDSSESGEDGGITPVGKAFLSLFILCLLFVICFVVYKYGCPKFQEQRRERNTDVTTTEATLDEGRNPLVAWCLRFQRKVPSEVNRPYHFVMAEGKLDQVDRNVVISETMETSSNDGYGTEMILEDLQEQEAQLPPSPHDRFTPSTLPQTKEFSAEDVDADGFPYSYSHNDQSSFNEAFSFSDVNIIIDDSSSYATLPPRYMEASKRGYSVPDTVNL